MSLLTKLTQFFHRFWRRDTDTEASLSGLDFVQQRLKFIEYQVDKSPDIILWVNVATAKISYADETAVELLGWSLEQLRTMSVADIELLSRNWQGLLLRLTDNAVWTQETTLTGKDNHCHDVEASFFLVSYGGRQTLIINARDIRHRLEMQAQIQQQIEALENNRLATANMLLDLAEAKKAIEDSHEQTQQSIAYASLIQMALMPDHALFRQAFADAFTMWLPKDVVGGDIYTLTPLRDKEWLLMVIDCTGHGVPGAFVSMLVKAIERQVIANLSFTQAEVNPADILAQFNVTIKNLLNQHSKDSVSDAGFDGAVIYYHQEKQKLLFSGANTPLFVMRQGELEMIKGNRQGIGYKHSDSHYVYTTHDIQVTPHMRCYVSTDGYLDQNGGEQDFPLGKTRFMNALLASQHLSMAEQEAYLMTTLANYQGNAMRNDDISMVGFSLS